MKLIPLKNRAKETVANAIVDDEDYERVIHHRWHLHPTGYVCTNIKHNGKYKCIRLHRFILNPPARIDVDHINHSPLDNQRCNLRWCTDMTNSMNKRRPRHNTSGFKGVSYMRKMRGTKRWKATINANGKQFHLGYFYNPQDARRKYEEAAIRLHGEFACL